MTLFAIATLTPVGLLLLGALWGGVWLLAALAYLTVLTYALDRTRALPVAEAAPGQEFPAGEGLSLVLGLAHFALLALAVWAVGGDSGLGMVERLLAVLGFGLFLGQVSNSNAHELIHRPGRGQRWLGVAVFSSVLFGHHASAHPKVHHTHVGSDQDPNSAPLGMGFYRFALRAWAGSFRAGWRAENALRARGGKRLSRLRHPYVAYLALSGSTLAGAAALAGGAGVAALIALALYAQMQLLLSDYVQHYGLRRRPRADGRLEPVGPQHSWNAAPWFSAAVMLNAPRHSDHHLNPARPYPALRLDAASMPVLPRSLPVMAMLALWPAAWRRVMDAKVALWQDRGGGELPVASAVP